MGKLYDSLPDGFLKKALEGEDPELVDRLLNLQAKYRDSQDKDEKVVYRERLATTFWQVYTEVAKKVSPDMPAQKRLLLRFGCLDMRYLNADDQKMILSRPKDENDPDTTVYYIDEWLIAVAEGKVKPSMTDEQPKQKKLSTVGGSSGGDDPSGNRSKYERIVGAAEAERLNYQNLLEKRKLVEENLLSIANLIVNHPNEQLLAMPDIYSDDQLAKLEELPEISRELRRLQKEMQLARNNYSSKFEEVNEMEKQMVQASGQDGEGMTPQLYEVDARTIENEAGALRQMIKMCVGRQGNHFPILTSAFIPKETREYNFKSSVVDRLAGVEGLDGSVFSRTFRQATNRILPYLILVPGYGNFGICWEPYDKYNKATSKGRIAIPIFTRIPDLTIQMALADFRWQTAKELASYHWMDEGLTGRYYEYFTKEKLKGDIKTAFIEDYMLWLSKEAQGIQKLHKDVRYIFWRFVPFPDDLKEKLSLKGFYYNELWKKEQTFRLSQE
ncbi:MAG: hypothetical protein A2Y33_01905 [Spirochaetes bacterium GWF1_51_8]|nr:MAG: hypothetical protein A2Y33_01905 [Spirochaetes bacterium GWF1_51_8]